MSSLTVPLDTFNLFPAAPTDHVMVFSRMPHVSFTVQTVDLPGVQATPGRMMAPGLTIHHAPDRLTYDPLNITFLVDDSLLAFRELKSWLVGISGGPDRTYHTAKFVRDQMDVVWIEDKLEHRLGRLTTTYGCLTLLNGAKLPKLRVLFHNMIPISLGPISWSTSADTLPAMTGTASFNYDYYTIIEVE